MSSTANMMLRRPSVFPGAFSGSALTAVGVWNFVSAGPAVAVRGPHHDDVDSDTVEPDDTVHPPPLDWRLALQLHTKFGKERSSSIKVVDNHADVVHPLYRHIPEHRGLGRPAGAAAGAGYGRPRPAR